MYTNKISKECLLFQINNQLNVNVDSDEDEWKVDEVKNEDLSEPESPRIPLSLWEEQMWKAMTLTYVHSDIYLTDTGSLSKL